jgi:hypothetical protein
VSSVDDEFRKNAEECRRLAERLRKPEHRQFARELASAWIELAELEASKGAAPTRLQLNVTENE